MLDECKGEKFYEILALFSSAVLKKVLAAQRGNDRTVAVARRLATAPTLSAKQQQSLLPLAIAHKVALGNVLKHKDEKRRRYLEFEKLLDAKAENIDVRIRKCKATPRLKTLAVAQKEAEAVKKQLTDNWIGDQRWLDVMLHGDNVQAEDAYLNSRFDKVWHMVEKGRKLQDVVTETGLLESLQSRVHEQETRLQKWKAFHEELREENTKSCERRGKGPATVMDFKFDDHTQHQLPTSKQRIDETALRRPDMSQEYQSILSDLDAELSRVLTSRIERPTISLIRRRTSSTSGYHVPARSRKHTRSESIKEEIATLAKVPPKPLATKEPSMPDIPSMPPPRRKTEAVTPADSEATLISESSTRRRVSSPLQNKESPVEVQHNYEHPVEPIPPASDPIIHEPSPSPQIYLSPKLEQHQPSLEVSPIHLSEPPIPVFDPLELNYEDELADQIITSIGDATPSPVKKPQPRMSLSLIERTRMSMARTTSFEPLPESPELPLPSMAPPPVPEDTEIARHESLLERTRLSMIAMQSKPRQSLAPSDRKEKRKSRQSLFPVNQFDTPRTRKSFELIEETKSIERTPTEVLFSDAVDYDRVFKSRPRIATSPVFSPLPGQGSDEEDFEEGVTGIDLGDVDQDYDDDDNGFTQTWADSPSRKKAAVRLGRY